MANSDCQGAILQCLVEDDLGACSLQYRCSVHAQGPDVLDAQPTYQDHTCHLAGPSS